MSGQAETNGPLRSPKLVIAALSMAMLLSSLGTSIANVALPTLSEALHASFQQVQWVVLSYLLTITALIVAAGRLGDLLGRRRVALAGLALFTIASLLCSLAPDIGTLIAARALQGAGAAVMMALTLSFAAGGSRVGSAMGLLGTMSAVGTALGPSLGGLLIATLGWQSIFLALGALGMAAFLLNYRSLPVDPARRPSAAGIDVAGTFWLVATLTAYCLALTLGKGEFGWINAALFAAAVASAFAFVRTARTAPAPLIRLQGLRKPRVGSGLAMSVLVTTVLMATLVVGPFYLAGSLGLDAAEVGLAMSAGPLVAAFAGVPAGRMVDRLGTSPTTCAGAGGVAVGSALLALLPTSLGVAGYLLSMALMTAGYALFQAANNTAVMTGVDPAERGLMSGLVNLSRNLGLITGASLMGALFALATGQLGSASPVAVASGMRLTFAAGALLALAALAIALSGRSVSRTATA